MNQLKLAEKAALRAELQILKEQKSAEITALQAEKRAIQKDYQKRIREATPQMIFKKMNVNQPEDANLSPEGFADYMVNHHKEPGIQDAIKEIKAGFAAQYDVEPRNGKLDNAGKSHRKLE